MDSMEERLKQVGDLNNDNDFQFDEFAFEDAAMALPPTKALVGDFLFFTPKPPEL